MCPPFSARQAALEARGIRVGPPLFGGRGHKPSLDADGRLTWRLVLIYPESDQSDLVEVVSEDDTLAEYLDGMFGADAPPLPWDAAGAYARNALEVYYQADLVAPYSGDALRAWLREGTPAGLGEAGVAADEATDAADASAWRAARAKTPRRARCDEGAPLRDIMAAPGHVLPSTLVLFVVARGTPARDAFLAGR